VALKVALSVLNVDLRDEETCEVIAEKLSHLVWSSVDRRVTATLLLDESSHPLDDDVVLASAMAAARDIHCTLPRARVERVAEALVAIPDIAKRLKVNRETVRSWVNGSRGPGGFPVHVGSLGGGDRGPTRVWTWARVNQWLDDVYRLGDGTTYPSDVQIARVNSLLMGSDARATRWLHANVAVTTRQAETPMPAYITRKTDFALSA
jgi:hypothetical protein